MIQLKLKTDEREILSQVLQSYLSDLRMEISHTDRLDFRRALKERKIVLMKVLSVLNKPSKQAA